MTYFGAMTKISKFINQSNKLYLVIYFGVHYNAQKEVYKKKHEMKVVNILFKNKKIFFSCKGYVVGCIQWLNLLLLISNTDFDVVPNFK